MTSHGNLNLTSLLCKSTSWSPTWSKWLFAIMSTMILYSLENIRSRAEKSKWTKVLVKHGGFTGLKIIQNFKTPVFVVWDVQSSNFCIEMGYRMTNQFHKASTARVACKIEKYHFAFSTNPQFFRFFKSGWQRYFNEFDLTAFFSWSVRWLKTWKAVKTWAMLCLLRPSRAAAWDSSSHCLWPLLTLLVLWKKKALILLELF